MLPAQNTTSISRPIEPIDRGLSDAVASIMNTVETVNGQAVARRLPSPELRQSISTRLAAVRNVLAPLRGVVERERVGRAVAEMLTGWINAKVADPQAKVAGYVTLLADLPCWAIEQVCHDAGRGRIEGLETAYPPSAATLHVLVEERLERLRKEQHDLITAGAVKLAPDPMVSEAERLRIGTRLIDLRDELTHGSDAEVAARLLVKREQNAGELAKQQQRVAAEYAAAGLVTPSPLALSLTARKAMASMDAERRGNLPVDHPTDAYQEVGS